MPVAIAPVAALLLGAGIILLGNGLQGLLLPVRATAELFSTQAIGLIGAAYPAGFVLSCIYTPHLVKRVGHIRCFMVLAAIAGVTVLMYALLVHPATWLALRMVNGFCFAGLFMVIESWLNVAAHNTNRGQVFSTYMMINLACVTAGQLLIMVGDPADFALFSLAAIAIILGLVPVGLTTYPGPPPLTEVHLRWRRLYRTSPVGVLGCLFVGIANGSFGSLGPVFANGAGLSVTEIALFMSAALIGGTIAQIPVGRISDRVDRRKVIVGTCLVAAAMEVVMMLAGDARTSDHLLPFQSGFAELPKGSLIVLALLVGASVYPLYGLCTAHTNDFVDRSAFVEASSGLLLTWGVGAAIGPVIAGAVMELAGLGGLFLFTSSIHLLFATFAIYRMTRRAAPPPDEREDFVLSSAAARTTSIAATLDPRAPDDAAAGEPERSQAA